MDVLTDPRGRKLIVNPFGPYMDKKSLKQRQMEKIKKIEELAEILNSLRGQGKKIVHCHGVFDLLHIGHIRYFEQAKRMGDVLVVTITADGHVDKGSHRPAFTETLRTEAAVP